MFDDLIWGVKWGVGFAIWFSGIGLLMVVVTGGEIVERQGVSLGLTLSVYWAGGLIGGIILGLLRPFTKRRIGAMMCGAIIMLVVGLLTGRLIIEGWGDQDGWAGLMGVMIGTTIMGAAAGYFYWEPPKDDEP